jgi:two-component system cell cycle response regulator
MTDVEQRSAPDRTPGALTTAAWVGLVVLLATEMLLHSPPAEERVRMILRGLPFLVTYAAAAVAAAVAASRAGGRREARLWTYLALASGLQLVAEVIVGLEDSFGVSARALVTATSFAGLLSLGATFALFALVFTMSPLARRPLIDRVRAGVDVTAAVLLGVAGAQLMAAGPFLQPLGVSLGTQVLASTRLVVGVALLGGVAFNVFGFQGRTWHSWDRLVALAIVFIGMGLLFWPLWYVGEFVYGWWVADLLGTLLFAVGGYLGLTAAASRLVSPGVPLERPSMPAAAPSTTDAVLVPLVLLAGVIVALLMAWADGASDVGRFLVIPVTASVLLLLAVRTVLLRVSGSLAASTALADPVSGAYAAAPLAGFLQREYEYAMAAGEPLSFVELDIDRLSAVNDRAGHRAGDAVLAGFAAALAADSPQGATVFRSGADAFAVVLPGVGVSQASDVAAELAGLAASASADVRVTASAGVATVVDGMRDADDLREAATEALHIARASGLGRVASAHDGSGRPLPRKAAAFLAVVHGLVTASEERVEFGHGHGELVGETAALLAGEAGMTELQVETVRVAGRLHDLGKMSVPDRVLDKPGPLDEEEERRLREHPVLASRMLAPVGDRELTAWVGDHHERWDGSGYPLGLSGKGISLGGRVLGIADEWENLIARQPTRRALSRPEAIARISAGAGTLWDPALVDVFLSRLAYKP